MIRKGLVLGVCALLLSACGLGTRADAAKGVEAFLRAAQARDLFGFEARIDRAALREDLRRQLAAVSRESRIEVEGGPPERVLDRMIGPEAFQIVQDQTGQALPLAPNAAQIALLLKPVDGGRVCLREAADAEACLLTFAKTGGRWRLTGMKVTPDPMGPDPEGAYPGSLDPEGLDPGDDETLPAD